MISVGINGFGRIGRELYRQSLSSPTINVVAINDPFLDTEQVAYAIKFDSTAGKFDGQVEVKGKGVIAVNGKGLRTFQAADPFSIPWADNDVSVVVDASGVFTTQERASAHMAGGARRVIIAGPSADAAVVVFGVNEDLMKPSVQVVSASSCTAVALAPVLHLLQTSYGVSDCCFTSIHSATSGHRLVDGSVPGVRDVRAGRSVMNNIAPTTTSATKQLQRLLPWTSTKVFGNAVRVPTTNVCLLDVTVRLETPVTKAALDALFATQCREGARLHGILDVTSDQIVSSDLLGDRHAAVYDSTASIALTADPAAPTTQFKLMLWYNNEKGYAQRLLALISRVAQS